MKTKKQYTAPRLTRADFRMEQGFAISVGTPMPSYFELFDGMDETQSQESWSEHSTWSSDGDNFF